MNVAEPYQPSRSLYGKVLRRLIQYRQAARARIELDAPLLSITFDDCPASAVESGAVILNRHGVKGGFYIATGLMDQETRMGRIVGVNQIHALRHAGHEIGAHSHDHIDYARADLQVVQDDIATNLARLRELCPTDEIESFAFPYGETSYEAKRFLAGHFSSLRGVLPGINRGRVDRAQLRAFELDRSPSSFSAVIAALDDLKAEPGWMIVFTHDVAETPSAFGVTPKQLERLIREAQSRGIEICTPSIAARKSGLNQA